MSRPVSAYITHVRVRFQECDPLGHLNNAVAVGYLEQAAFDHAALLGWPVARLQREVGGVFVVRRHDLTFHQPAFENEVLQILTWPADLAGVRALRRYEVRRIEADPYSPPPSRIEPGDAFTRFAPAELVLSGYTEFVLANLERGRPMRVPPDVSAGFLVKDES